MKNIFCLCFFTNWGFLKYIIPIVSLQKKAFIMRPTAHAHRKGKSEFDSIIIVFVVLSCFSTMQNLSKGACGLFLNYFCVFLFGLGFFEYSGLFYCINLGGN